MLKKTLLFLLCILIPLIIGAFGGIVTASGVNDWYLTIVKPSFNPPNYVFGPVWSALYILMGISLFLILKEKPSIQRKQSIIIFGIQLILNFLWSFLFFKFQLLGIAFIEIILIWISVFIMILLFSKLNKTAAVLQIPYLLWVSFASVLNASIWFLNN